MLPRARFSAGPAAPRGRAGARRASGQTSEQRPLCAGSGPGFGGCQRSPGGVEGSAVMRGTKPPCAPANEDTPCSASRRPSCAEPAGGDRYCYSTSPSHRVPHTRRRVRRTRRSQPIATARCCCAQRRNSSDVRGCSLGGRCGRTRHSAAAAKVGAHVCAGTCYACIRHAGRRRSVQCTWVPQGARVQWYFVSTVSTPALLACVRCGSAARVRGVDCFLRACAQACASPAAGTIAAVWRTLRARLRLSRARGLRVDALRACA